MWYISPEKNKGIRADVKIIGRCQPKTKSSRALQRVEVSEIGLKSESADIGLDILAIETTSAHFHKVGTVPWLTDPLKIESTGLQITEAHSLSNQFGILYTPISNSVVGENDDYQLSKGDCTAEKNVGIEY